MLTNEGLWACPLGGGLEDRDEELCGELETTRFKRGDCDVADKTEERIGDIGREPGSCDDADDPDERLDNEDGCEGVELTRLKRGDCDESIDERCCGDVALKDPEGVDDIDEADEEFGTDNVDILRYPVSFLVISARDYKIRENFAQFIEFLENPDFNTNI
jgi:hypothetical protein